MCVPALLLIITLVQLYDRVLTKKLHSDSDFHFLCTILLLWLMVKIFKAPGQIRNQDYSYFNACIGLAKAALIAWNEMVESAITNASNADKANIHHCMLM
jgi:hypothetical protein